MNSRRGMTLVELMVSLAIAMIIIGVATTAYVKLQRTHRTHSRLSQDYMDRLNGLKLLRYDIEMAGFGLPSSLAPGATYTEAAAVLGGFYNPALLNDSGSVPSGPRALAHLNNSGANNSDVLVIKSSAANTFNNSTGKKWSMILSAPTPQVKLWGDPVMDFTAGGGGVNADNFIILDNTGLLLPGEGQWSCYKFNAGYFANASAIPYPNPQYVYYIFGLDNSTGGHNMPFNRVDYYLDNIPGAYPSYCAPNTYTLYRSVVDQVTGQLNPTPLIDCVMDFQVAFGLVNGAGAIQWQDNLVGMSAVQIQQQLREVRVFVLYQEGRGDTGKSPDFRASGIFNLGDQDIAHGLDSTNYPAPPNGFQQWSSLALPGTPSLSTFNPAAATAGADNQYRWKILEMDVKPMNLLNLTNVTPR